MDFDKIKKWIPFLCFIGIPLLITTLFKNEEWLARIIAIFIAVLIGIPTLIYYSLNPQSNIISEGAKLNKPGYEKQKKIVLIIMRLIYFMLGIFLLFIILIPLSNDVFSLIYHRQQPLIVKGNVIENSSPFGIWIMIQTIRIEMGIEKQNYYLLYSLSSGPRRNKMYEFKILPKSKLILEANLIQLD